MATPPSALHAGLRQAVGRVYDWEAPGPGGGEGRLRLGDVPLTDLRPDSGLAGRFVEVENAGVVREPVGGTWVVRPIGNARPDGRGAYRFEPGIGGGRLDKNLQPDPGMRERYVAASHFGEVNTYFHVTRIARYLDGLLALLTERSVPKVRVRVHAHPGIPGPGRPADGTLGRTSGRWLPFQGGHYRLPSATALGVPEHAPLAPQGEIHLGPGWRLTDEGLLPRLAGRRYRCNASHNAGIIYHEYGHHLVRHTADLLANSLKAPHRQVNRKSAADEGLADYWAAALMGTPHIWCLHRRHDDGWTHPRSLSSSRTMSTFDRGAEADPHVNGTILASALWDLRCRVAERGDDPATCDQLVLAAMVELGALKDDPYRPTRAGTRALRDGFGAFRAALEAADADRFGGRHLEEVRAAFEDRGILASEATRAGFRRGRSPAPPAPRPERLASRLEAIRRRDPEAVLPADHELVHPDGLEAAIRAEGRRYAVVACGDVMLGERAESRIRRKGPDFTFAWVLPVLRRGSVVLGNLEGPFARKAEKLPRNHSYRVDPGNARILRRAGFNVMTLANNHLLDCGRDGVLESLAALRRQGIAAVGCGRDESRAHDPAVLQAGPVRLGILGYYWNRRTSARGALPGSARDLPELVERDLEGLRPRCDRIVVTVHWGVPYEREPSEEDRRKARHMVECGADVVIGHHPHVVQPYEIYRNRPIFYSVGNFAFGSGNSRAESLLLGIAFEEGSIEVDVFAVHARNRDPRVAYQPKVMVGPAARAMQERLAGLSGADGDRLELGDLSGRLVLPDATDSGAG